MGEIHYITNQDKEDELVYLGKSEEEARESMHKTGGRFFWYMITGNPGKIMLYGVTAVKGKPRMNGIKLKKFPKDNRLAQIINDLRQGESVLD